MSSRALRKAQREREEQKLQERLQKEAEALEKEHEPVAAPKKSPFAMLQEEEGEPEDEPEDEESGAATPNEPASSIAPKAATSKKKKKKKTKNGTGTPTQDASAKEDIDEIDAALKSLSANRKSADYGETNAASDAKRNEAHKLIGIETTNLHAVNEMKRLFGRAALEQEREDDTPAGGNRRQQRRVQQVGLAQALRGQRQNGRPGGLIAMGLRRNIFIQGKEEWPNATGGGLGMEVEEKRADGTVLYKFVHNTAYQDVQSQFETCVASMDPNRMVVLLQHNPYHISTLLQVSEIAKSERDHTTSGELLERALFSFGRAVHSTFAKNLAEGKARLDFRRAENREFWLASWRYIQNLTMRATYRTVYEWAKMLLALSPYDDPYAMWLILDQYALRSRQDLDFVNLSNNAWFSCSHSGMPNIAISQGLAEYRSGNKSKGQQQLFRTFGQYPWMIVRLMQELNADAPPVIWGKEPRSEKEKLYAELYATRAKDVWNTPENTELLIEISSAIPAETPMASVEYGDITLNEARHILLSDVPSLIALVPREYTSKLDSASDPLPPEDAYPSYIQRQERDRDRDAFNRMFGGRLVLGQDTREILGDDFQELDEAGRIQRVEENLQRLMGEAEENAERARREHNRQAYVQDARSEDEEDEWVE